MDACTKYDQSLQDIREKSATFPGATDEEWRKHANNYIACMYGTGVNVSEDVVATEVVTNVFEGSFPKNKPLEDLVKQQIEALNEGKSNTSNDSSQEEVAHGADPVMMFNGQFIHEVEDIRINGAGIDFVFKRTYKNQVPFNGPLGFNWIHNLHIWLRVANQTIFRSTGDLREEAFTKHPKFDPQALTDDFNYWIPPDGKHGVIFASANSFTLRMPNGVRYVFERDLAHTFLHRLKKIDDRHGNYLELSYDQDDLLQQVEINHPTRLVAFEYDEQGRICLIQDYTGRQWHYAYDSIGDLIAVTSPATDRYKEGLTVCYDYSSAFQTGELQHNLTRIIDAAGQIYLENEYGTGPGLLNFNRIVRQRQGGGEYRFEYEDFVEELDFDYPDEQRPAHQTIMVERNGQPICHVYNKFGNLLLKEQSILQDGLLRTLVEHYRYNRDGNVVASLSPEGVLTQHLYGRDYFIRQHGLTPNGEIRTDLLTWRERQAFGRVRATVLRDGDAGFQTFNLTQGIWGDFPDIINGIFGIFPAGMGKRENDIIVKYTYEEEFGQLKTVSDSRFTNSADPHALNEHPRHQETLTKYDYNSLTGDPPNRFLVEIRRPVPTLPDGTLGGDIVEEFRNANGTPGYDKRGRLLRHINPVKAVTEYTYFPEDPTDPLEGHLQRIEIDPDDSSIITEYEVDELGRVEAVHLPRSVGAPAGHFVTRTKYNELDQVTKVTSSEPFKFETQRFYDRNGKLERVERDAKDETGADIPDGPEILTFEYDEEFKPIQETLGGADLSAHLVTRHCYDSASQRVLTILPEGNQMRYRYDERLLPVAGTMGAGTDDAATTRTEYDGDGRVRRTLDARGNPTTFTLDAFGRVIAEENALGHITLYTFDKAGNVLVTRHFEKQGDRYRLLARGETGYDELNRPTRAGVNRFDMPPGPPLTRNQLDDALLQSPGPGNLLVIRTFYDAQGRVERVVDPVTPTGRETHFKYDNLDRVEVETDPLGNEIQSHYDTHSNLIRRDRIEIDVNSPTGRRVFSNSFTYDELDRMVSSTDSLGNVTRYFYDSRGNQVRRIDPLGNVVTTEYDIYNRSIAEHRELTETGLGGSTVEDTADTTFEYDKNGNLKSVIDARDRRTQYLYDALDRRRAIIYPDKSEFKFDYDRDNNLIRTTDNNGLQRRYTVDELGRTTRVDVDKSGLVGVQVEGAMFERYAYDGLDRRHHEENDFAHCDIRFNSLGWPLVETITFTTADAPLNTPFVISREFDDVGALTDLTYPNGRRLHFGRDDLDRLTLVQNQVKGNDYPGSPATPDVHDIVSKIDYTGFRRVRCHFGNGAGTTYAHDGAARVIEIAHTSPAGPFLKIQYLFDAVGNVRIRKDIKASGDIGEAFAYDSLYRLVNEDQKDIQTFDPIPLAPAPAVLSVPIPNRQAELDVLIGSLALPPNPHTYDYDLVGNRDEEKDGNEIDYAVNELDQYTDIANLTTGVTTNLKYDANGNLKNDGQQTYIYDSLNRLVRVEDTTNNAPIAEFFHDARGRRILELVNGTATQLICDGDNLIAEYQNGDLRAQYVHDDGVDRPLQIVAEGSEHWYHCDLVGSVRLLTDRNGDESMSYQYAPFGKMSNDPGGDIYNPLKYTSRRLDEVLRTYDYRARQYDPQWGRFLQRDPGGMADGTNLFTYTINNPIGYNDPFGMNRKESEKDHDFPAALATRVALIGTDAALTPRSPTGKSLPGQFQVWTGPLAKTEAYKVANAGNGYADFQTKNYPEAVAAEKALYKRVGAAPGTHLPDKAYEEYKKIWLRASRRNARGAGGSGGGFTSHNNRAELIKKLPVPIQIEELKTGAWWGAMRGAAGLAGPILSISDAASGDMPIEIIIPTVVFSSIEGTGALAYGIGAIAGDGVAMAAGTTFMRAGASAMLPIAVAAGAIHAYRNDPSIQQHANAAGDALGGRTVPVWGGIVAAGSASGEAVYKGTKGAFVAVGTGIGEGAGFVYIRVTSDQYTLGSILKHF